MIAERPSPGRDIPLLLTASGLLLVVWSLVVPIFEAPDEFLHWQYARHLHDTWQLPVYSALFAEGNSPPLYYAVVAPVASPSPLPSPVGWIDGRDEFVRLPGARFYMNAGDDFTRYGPIRRARLITALMSMVTIWLCALAALEVTGRQSTALLAAGFVAFLPQFTFRGMNVSNDAMVTTMAACLLLLLLRLIRRGFTWRVGIAAAVVLAAAYLSKINAIALVPPFVAAIVTARGPWRTRLVHLGVLGVTLLIVAPWTARNVWLYGDPFATAKMYDAVEGMIFERSLWDWHHVTTLPRELFKSFVGYFGYLSVKLPKWVYAVYLAGILFALAGLSRIFAPSATEKRTVDGDPRWTWIRVLIVLVVTILCSYAVVVRINVQFAQTQGRYMFPALPALAVAVAIGLEQWRPWRKAAARWPARATVAAWGAVNLAVLGLVVVPAYYPPLVAARSDAQATIVPTAFRDLTPAADGRFTIVGPHPELTAIVRIAAADARFVIFDLEGGAGETADTSKTPGSKTPEPKIAEPKIAEPTGVVVFTLGAETADDGSPTREVRLPFVWRADGKRRTIFVTTLDQPAWDGTVTRVSIRPMGDANGASGVTGSTGTVSLRLEQIRVVGRIPS